MLKSLEARNGKRTNTEMAKQGKDDKIWYYIEHLKMVSMDLFMLRVTVRGLLARISMMTDITGSDSLCTMSYII